jgi:hypothetical protein
MLKSLTGFTTALLLILLNIGCKDDCVSPKGIYVDWIWTRTYDNHHGITTTPEDLGYTEKLSIDDFTFKQYINDSLVYESQYDLITRADSLNNEGKFIVFPSGYEQKIHVDESQLILTETIFFINPTSYYKRI